MSSLLSYGGEFVTEFWMDLVPTKWFEFKHDIHSFAFCNECDLYGEKAWDGPYRAVLIDAPWPMFRDKERWIWVCVDCWGEEE
jgi:hypothetical protein